MNSNLATADTKIKVITTIKPIDSILSNIAGSAVEIDYLMTGNTSAHGYTLKPSDIEKFKSSSMIVIIDRKFDLEVWKIIQKLGLESKVVELSKTPDLVLYKNRNIQILSHDDESEGHHTHHHHHHAHEHEESQNNVDFHIWLSLSNVKKLASYFVSKLIEMSDYKLKDFEKNLIQFYDRCDQLNYEINTILTPFKNKGFIIFHDGYQYFEKQYGLTNLGAIYYGAGESIGLKTMLKVEDLVKNDHISCILTEPYFNSHVIEKIKENKKIKIAEIDGESIQNLPLNKDTYFIMMSDIARKIAYCLE